MLLRETPLALESLNAFGFMPGRRFCIIKKPFWSIKPDCNTAARRHLLDHRRTPRAALPLKSQTQTILSRSDAQNSALRPVSCCHGIPGVFPTISRDGTLCETSDRLNIHQGPLTKMFNPSISKLATLVLLLFVLAAPLEAQSNFSWTLSQSGLASAGVFDSEDRLVRTLWAMETFNSGTMGGSWDGCDDFGTPVSSGAYTVKILKNNSTYNNIGAIGNTGTPPHTFGHVPFSLEGVAIDAQNNVYTVHNWDEAHFDVIKWSPVDGQAVMNSDHPIGNALLGGITVEPDGSHAYVTGFFSGSDNDSLDDRSKSRFAIWRVNMAPGLNVWERTTNTNFSQQGRCIKVYDGSSPGYPDSGPPNYPGWATPADKEVMRVPLVSIVVNGEAFT